MCAGNSSLPRIFGISIGRVVRWAVSLGLGVTGWEEEVGRAANESTRSFPEVDHYSRSKLIKATGMTGPQWPDHQHFPAQPFDQDFKVTFPDH